MTNEELVEQYQNSGNKEILHELYFRNDGLIKKQANIFRYRVDFEELAQEGFFAVCRAADTYNSASGGKFASWLCWWLRSYFTKAAINNGVFVVPSDKYGKYRRYKKVISEYQLLNGCDPDKQTLCELARISLDDLEHMQVLDSAINPVRLDAAINEESEESLLDFVPDNSAPFEDSVIEAVDNAKIWSIVDNTLQPEQAILIRKVFKDGKTLKQVADETTVPYETITTRKEASIRKLKAYKNRFRPFADDYIQTKSIRLSGVGFWKEYGSSTEYIAIEQLEH